MPDSPRPELSVVIPTHNRAESVRRCLESLDRQDAPAGEFEVIVVVDGSTDGTASLLRSLSPPFALTVVEQDQAGGSAARNAGAARASGRLLLFIDDDVEAQPRLVSAHLAAHRTGEPVLSIGAITHKAASGADRLARIRAERIDAFSSGRAGRALTYRDCFGGNISLPHDAFRETGGFAVDLPRHNDLEFGYRAQAVGLRLVFVPEAVVCERRLTTWRQIIAEEDVRGRLAVELYHRHPPMLALLWLGSGGLPTGSVLKASVARLAVNARVPARGLALAALAIPARRWTNAFYLAACYTAHWRGVRSAADRELWRSARSGVVILGYHAFTVDAERSSRYVVSDRAFVRQLKWLKRRGYNVITLGEYLDYRFAYRPPPPRTVVITVDDGNLDTATVARPALERFGFRATLFLIGRTRGAASHGALVDRALIAPAEATSLLGETFEIGAHTLTHPNLTAIPPAQAETEIAGSKRLLEDATGRPVAAFAYPYGKFDSAVVGLVKKAGFAVARGITPGPNLPSTDPYDLRYTEIRGTDSLLRFAASLALLGNVGRRR